MSAVITSVEDEAADIARALRGCREGQRWRVPCPFVEQHKRTKGCSAPSVLIETASGGIRCRCDAGCSESEILAVLGRRGFIDWSGSVEHTPDPEAIAIWRAAVPVENTVGHDYLRGIGITTAPPPSLRYRPPGRYRLPMIVAAVQAPDRAIIAAHLIVMDRDKPVLADIPRPHLTVGALGRGAVRLAAGDDSLVLADTVEDALLTMQTTAAPAWAPGVVTASIFPRSRSNWRQHDNPSCAAASGGRRSHRLRLHAS